MFFSFADGHTASNAPDLFSPTAIRVSSFATIPAASRSNTPILNRRLVVRSKHTRQCQQLPSNARNPIVMESHSRDSHIIRRLPTNCVTSQAFACFAILKAKLEGGPITCHVHHHHHMIEVLTYDRGLTKLQTNASKTDDDFANLAPGGQQYLQPSQYPVSDFGMFLLWYVHIVVCLTYSTYLQAHTRSPN